MRRRLIKNWHIMLFLVVEWMFYEFSGYVTNRYQQAVWDEFNQYAYTIHEINSTMPYAEMINRYARESGINPQIVASLIQVESSFRPQAVSNAGAYGLMQIMPETWWQVNKVIKVCDERQKSECSTTCYYNPELNIRIGIAYLSQLLKKYHGNMVLALAAYNAGPGAVDRYDGIPPYAETIYYIKCIIMDSYHLENKSISGFIAMAKQWNTIHSMMGWLLFITGIIFVWIVWRRLRYQLLWRWR